MVSSVTTVTSIKAVPELRDFDKICQRFDAVLSKVHACHERLRAVGDRLRGPPSPPDSCNEAVPQPNAIILRLDSVADDIIKVLTNIDEELSRLETL